MCLLPCAISRRREPRAQVPTRGGPATSRQSGCEQQMRQLERDSFYGNRARVREHILETDRNDGCCVRRPARAIPQAGRVRSTSGARFRTPTSQPVKAGERRVNPGRKQLLDWIDRDRDDLVRFLQAFVRQRSPNPPGDTRDVASLSPPSSTSRRCRIGSSHPIPKCPISSAASTAQTQDGISCSTATLTFSRRR